MQASLVPSLGPIRPSLGMGTNDGDGDGDGNGNGLETWGFEYRLIYSPAKPKYPRMRQGIQWYGTDGSNGSNGRQWRQWEQWGGGLNGRGTEGLRD